MPVEREDLRNGSFVGVREAYRVALLIPLCGSAGLWAPSCISSAQVAVAELNATGGISGRRVQLIMIDAALEAFEPVYEGFEVRTGSITILCLICIRGSRAAHIRYR